MSNWMPKAGWGLSILTSLLLLASGVAKIAGVEPVMKNFEHLGFSASVVRPLGIVEALIAILLLVPRTAFVGAILSSGYLGGAVCTHLRIGEPLVAPIMVGVLCWVGYGLRNPGLMRQLLGLRAD